MEIAVRADVFSEYLALRPAPEPAVAGCREQRVVGLLDPVGGVGIAAELGIAQVDLRGPRQLREFVSRFDIPGVGVDPAIDGVVAFKDELAMEQDVGIEAEETALQKA